MRHRVRRTGTSRTEAYGSGVGAKMNLKVNAALPAVVLLLLPVNVYARAPGDPQKGQSIAQRSCASCHAIDAGEVMSPNPRAPAFASLARTPGMTAIALRAG